MSRDCSCAMFAKDMFSSPMRITGVNDWCPVHGTSGKLDRLCARLKAVEAERDHWKAIAQARLDLAIARNFEDKKKIEQAILKIKKHLDAIDHDVLEGP